MKTGLLLSLLLVGTASAQPIRAAQSAPQSVTTAPRLSPRAAAALSVGTTITLVAVGGVLAGTYLGTPEHVGYGLIAVGAFVGPSTGNIVQGNSADALIGGGIRVASVFLLAVDPTDGEGAAPLKIGAGLAVFVAGAVYDVVTADQHARRVRSRLSVTGASRTPVAVLVIPL